MRWSGTGSNSWTNEPTDRMAGACSQIDARGSNWAPLFVHLLLHTPLYSLLTLLILPHYTIPRSRIQNQGCVTSSFLPPAFTSPNLPFFLFFSFLLLFYIFFPLSLSLPSFLFRFSPRYDTIDTVSYHARCKIEERFFRSRTRKISNFSPNKRRGKIIFHLDSNPTFQ